MRFLAILFSCFSLFSTDIVVCSFNRPMQLYALLESIEKRVTGYDNIFVILRSDERFMEGYKIVEDCFSEAEFIYQPSKKREAHASFKKMVIDVLYNEEKDLSDYFVFAMDDIVVLDDIDLRYAEKTLEERPDIHCFFYRLGKNITKYYAWRGGNGRMKLPPMQEIDENIFTWKFRQGKVEWNYPNTLDFSVYRKTTMKKACIEPAYHDPNTLEGAWQQYLPRNGTGVCYGWSKLVNLPMNRVNTSIHNRFLGNYSVDDLNKLFIEGNKMDIYSLDKSLVNSPHQDIPFDFISRE